MYVEKLSTKFFMIKKIPPTGGPVGAFKTVYYLGLFGSQTFFMGVDEIHEVDVFLVADIEAVHRDMVVEVSVELVKERVAISIGIFAEVIPQVVFHLQLLNKEPCELVRTLHS